jgi:hypothetical protein
MSSKSVVISTSADKRTIPDGLKKMAICSAPKVNGPPPVRVDVSGGEFAEVYVLAYI